MSIEYTKNAKKVLDIAKALAITNRQKYIESENILFALIVEEKGFAGSILKKFHKDIKQILLDISSLLELKVFYDKKNKEIEYSDSCLEILELAYKESKRFNLSKVATEHILLAIIQKPETGAYQILKTHYYDFGQIYNTILYTNIENNPDLVKNLHNENESFIEKEQETEDLENFSKDFTKLAKENKLDTIIGREEELSKLMQILSRRNKNNPCLIGEAGVGKTAIVEALAQKIISNQVPSSLSKKRILSLDLTAIVAGTKYRGEFEERIKNIINEVVNSNDIILFIDEIHTMIGTGSAEGSLDISNILKPYLSRGQLQLIGATTIEEYRKYMEKDSALERRFQSILVEEPNIEESIRILKGIKKDYENFHNIDISDSAIESAVKLSVKYLPDRFLPDKAIDLLDESLARLKIKDISDNGDSLNSLKQDLSNLDEKKFEAVKKEDFELVNKLLLKQKNIKKKIKAILEAKIENKKELSVDDIAETLSSWTKIPLKSLTQDETLKLKSLEENLKKSVIAQEEAIKAVVKAVKRGRLGIKDPKRPIGSFLFLGPTGVGKTQLSKSLAKALFSDENALLRIDMSEYMEKHTVSKLIGSPPGYVGYEDSGILSKKVRKNPYSIILFDEIEKAHIDIFNILLQILDDGHISDSQGRKINFKNTIIIMTSNIGALNIVEPKQLGFISDNDENKEYESMKNQVFDELKKVFKPEFLNRIDELIVFHQLSKENLNGILEILIRELAKRLKEELKIDISFSDKAKEFIIDKAYDKKYGARPLKRKLRTLVEDKLIEDILDEKIKKNDDIFVDLISGEIEFINKSDR